ncbi:MAG: hypothetical protein AAGB31_15010 [Bdellovibrio sp.]
MALDKFMELLALFLSFNSSFAEEFIDQAGSPRVKLGWRSLKDFKAVVAFEKKK